MFESIKNIDEKILSCIAKFRRPFLDKFMVCITRIGNTGAIWLLISLALLVSPSNRKSALKIISTLFLTSILGEIIIKSLVGRLRPSKATPQEQLLIKKPKTYSFPSGHTASSFAAASMIGFEYPVFVLPAFFLAISIAFSRLYLKVHYPSDVLAGAFLGVTCSAVIRFLA